MKMWSSLEELDVRTGISVVLAFALLSVVVSLLNSYLYTSSFLDKKVREIETVLKEQKEFSKVARGILDVRPDVAYIRLVDDNGILKESLGSGEGGDIREFRFLTPEKNTVIVGIREDANRFPVFGPLMWSVFMGVVLSLLFLFFIFFTTPSKDAHLEKLISAMKRVSRGDLTAKLDIDKGIQGNLTLVRVFEGFNSMVDQLRKRYSDYETTSREYQVSESAFRVVVSEKRTDASLRRVVALVAKISNFKELSQKVEGADFSSCLTEYRKAASSIISDYGGFTEALLQDEIVAIFNVPDEQDKPDLRAVCAAVELLQFLSNMNRQRKLEGKEIVVGKVAIDAKPLAFYSDSGVPQNVKEVISLARDVCDKAPVWKVVVSSEVYKQIEDFVDAKEIGIGDKSFFSIVAVEEGVIQV
ncbi:MAG: hypothetical protein KatS3mg078_1873 [Deltaproteobacteria bacterium]|nr:MAG: hypothetical protein KatS3mg078_1873 [Deltaproteobacteria bacterium]